MITFMNMSSELNTQENTNYSFFAFNILKAKGKLLFQNDKAMECLTRSDIFFKEQLKTLSSLYFNDITPQKFIEIIQNLKIAETDQKRLLLIAQLYQSYVEIMEQNEFKIPPYSASIKQHPNSSPNPVIQKRIQYILDSFTSNTLSLFNATEKTQCQDVSYIEFSDIQSETLYIINEIKSLVANGLTQYNEIAVFIDKTEARKKFIDIVKAQNLPVTSSIYNEDYENLKNKISTYRKISDLFLELSIDNFSYEEIKNITIPSKAKKETCIEQLDEIFKNILTEIIQNSKTTDKLFSKSTNSRLPIIEIIFPALNNLEENDKIALSSEFRAIKAFYEEYKNKKYANAINSIIKKHLPKFKEKLLVEAVTGKMKSLNDLENLFKKLENTEPEFDSFEEIMQGLPQDKEKAKNAIYLASISKKNSKPEKFKYIYIAGLTRNNYPAQNNSYPFISIQTNKILTEKLQEISSGFEYFLTTDEIYFQYKLQDFCQKMSLATNKITLTTHSYEAKKQTQPSIFFKVLCDADNSNFLKIENNSQTENEKFSSQTNISQSKTETNPIISNKDILKLNASAISTFQKCPRKYYYKNLLNLKEPYTFSANYGSIVHAVFQVLNTRAKNNYNKKMALALAKVLFNSAENETRALQAGFSQTDIELVKACPKLQLEEMQDNFNEAIDDFSLSGGFDNPPIESKCEQTFSFTLEEIPNVIFDGRIDAILTTSDGNVKIIDYKTGKNKTNTLDYAISDYGVNFKLKTGKEPTNPESLQKVYDYQIPIYYLACQNSTELKELKDKVTSLGLVYIRPKSKENGCAEDFITAEKLEKYNNTIIKNLKETIIDKIINETEFVKTKSWDCDNCAYKFLCDKEEN